MSICNANLVRVPCVCVCDVLCVCVNAGTCWENGFSQFGRMLGVFSHILYVSDGQRERCRVKSALTSTEKLPGLKKKNTQVPLLNFAYPSYPVTMATEQGHMGGAKISSVHRLVFIILY